jgi:hypothetical protein
MKWSEKIQIRNTFVYRRVYCSVAERTRPRRMINQARTRSRTDDLHLRASEFALKDWRKAEGHAKWAKGATTPPCDISPKLHDNTHPQEPVGRLSGLFWSFAGFLFALCNQRSGVVPNL